MNASLPRLLLTTALVCGVIISSARPQNSVTGGAQLPPVMVNGVAEPARQPAASVFPTVIDLPAQPGLTLAGLAAETPNFAVADNRARSFGDIFSLRGLINTPFFGDPSVTLYLDDMPLGSAFMFPSDLAGFARAELLRGPGQNTRFGRAGSAGVLQLNTQVASSILPEGSMSLFPANQARASAGNYGAVSGAASVAAAKDSLDTYVGLAGSRRDGYIRNTTLGTDIDGQDSLSGLVRLGWQATPQAKLTLLATGQRARDGVQPLVPLSGGPIYTVARSAEGRTSLDALNLALGATVDMEAGKLNATISHNYWRLDPYSNLIKFSPFFSLVNDVTQEQRLWNGEIRFVSGTSDPFAVAGPRWSLGVFGSTGDTSGSAIRHLPSGFVTESSTFRTDVQSLAAFGEVTFRLSDKLALTPGLRVENNQKDFRRTEIKPAPHTTNLTAESNTLLPKLELIYTPEPKTRYFASAGAGYKPGGFSAYTGSSSLAAFGPERTTAYEVGATHEYGSITITARVFYYAITGYQIERSFLTTATTSEYLVINAPRARSLGGELETEWRATKDLTLAAGVGATDVQLTRFTDPFTGTVFNGNRAPAVPVWNANLRADWHDAIGWFAGAQATGTGRTNYTEDEATANSQRPYGLLSAHLGWENARWRITLHGENLTGEEYFSSIVPGVKHGTPGAPRTYGLDVTVKF